MTSIRTTFRARPRRLKRITSAPCRPGWELTNLIGSNLTLAYFTLRLDDFSPLSALGLFLALGGITVFLGIRSLAGLGPVRKWVAIGVRLGVILLLILILGDIKLVRKNTDVELMVVRDISQSTGLVTDFPGKFLQSSLDDYLLAATGKANSPSRRDGDRVGEISFNEARISTRFQARRFRWRRARCAGRNRD